MGFFDDPDVEDMAELHAERIITLEEKEARRVLARYKEVRRELQDRLFTLQEGTFSAQKAQGTLFQIDQAIDAMGRYLKSDMATSGREVSFLGAEDLLTEIRKWDKKFAGAITPINLDTQLVASNTSELLFNKYDTSIDAYSESLRATMSREIANGVIAELDAGTMISRIGKFFLGEHWKVERLVRTELHGIYNGGKIEGMKSLAADEIPTLKKTLWHKMDSRTGKDSIRLNQNNPIVDVDKEFVENSTGKTLRYMAPPNRPNDRAILIPYIPGWVN